MKKLLLMAATIFAAFSTLRADISYLLVQGEFDSGSTGAETYLWKVLYQPGTLGTSQDLLNTIFGVPTDSGAIFNDSFGGSHAIYAAGNAQRGVSYIDFGSVVEPSYFVISYSFNGIAVTMDPSYDPGWTSYVAGGTGESAVGTFPNQSFGNYPGGQWSFSQERLTTRGLTNDSYDGWVFDTSNNPISAQPTATAFANATVINLVPEPGGALLLVLGGAGLLARRRRQ